MSNLYQVSSSPHIREKHSTEGIMFCVIIALLPAAMFGSIQFGWYALFLILLTVASCVASEWLFNKITKKKNTLHDLSVVVTGLILGLNLPPTLPWFMPILGGAFAIMVVKGLFGGLGQNFMNPAAGGRAFLVISFTGPMTHFVAGNFGQAADAVSSATGLTALKAGESVNLMNMFLGTEAGAIGEVSTLALLIGAIFLILMRIIDLRIAGTYLLSVVVFLVIFGGRGFDWPFIAAHLCGGGLMLGAFFMATDYVTAPITPWGQIIYGITLGLLTVIFRIFSGAAEGVMYSIIFANLLVPLIEKVTVPKAFGKDRKSVKAREAMGGGRNE